MWEFCRTTYPKARKAHTCDHCAKAIEKGAPYMKAAGRMEGDFMVFKAHEDCRQAASVINDLRDYDFDEGVTLECTEFEAAEKAMLLEKFPAVAARLGLGRCAHTKELPL